MAAATAGNLQQPDLRDFAWLSAEAQRVAGSLFGSMQQVPMHEQAISSYVFPSGVGMWAVPTASGLTMSGVMSGAGFSAAAIPMKPRQFWLIADAELIVYVQPNLMQMSRLVVVQCAESDGTFRFQMSFQDGLIDYPIVAVAADGEQTRSIQMKFNRKLHRGIPILLRSSRVVHLKSDFC